MLPTPIAPTTPMFGGVAINPPSSKLAALAGLLAGLRSGYGDIQKGHEQDALRQQALAKQAQADAFERQRIAIDQQNADTAKQRDAANAANQITDNTTADITRVANQPIGSPVAYNLGAAIYGRENPDKLDPAAAQAGQGYVKESLTPLANADTSTQTVAGVPMQVHALNAQPNRLPFSYQATGNDAARQAAIVDAAKAQDATTTKNASDELGRRYQAAMAALPNDRPIQAGDVQKFTVLWRQVEDPTLQAAAKRSFQPPQEIKDYMAADLATKNATNKQNVIVNNPTPNNHDEDALNKSYELNANRLAALRKPFSDQSERMSRLITSVNAVTPQADALIAPELLTAFAGGQGSGLRMNEAEISRIVGGRTNFEGLQAALNKWQLDPTKGLSVTPAQRDQIRSLITEMNGRLSSKLGMVDDALDQLAQAPDIKTQRNVVIGVQKGIDAVTATGQGSNSTKRPQKQTPNGWIEQQPDGGWVTIPAPGGK